MTEKQNEFANEIMDDQVVQSQTNDEELFAEDVLRNPPRESIELLRRLFEAGIHSI